MVKYIDYTLTVQSDNVVRAVATDANKVDHVDRGRLDQRQLGLARGYVRAANAGMLESRQQARELGELLFAALFAGSIGYHFREQAWRRMVNDPDQETLIRLRIVFQQDVSPQIVSLPWEFLYAHDTYLSAHPRVALSYQYDDWLAQPLDGYATQEPLRVLFAYSTELGGTFVERAANDIGLLARGQARVSRLADPTPESLEERVRTFKPHVLHFLGHGRFDRGGGFFALLDKEGKDLWVDDQSFSELFGRRPHLVVLHSCEGGQLSALQPYVGGAAWLARRHVPAVVAMRYPITQGQGRVFAHAFYEALAEGRAVDVAVQAGRRALALDKSEASRSNYIFAAPVLWMRLRDGRLFPPPAQPEPVQEDEHAEVRQAYNGYIRDLYAEHLIRGFSPHVSGRVLSLPLAEIFLPLRAVEGRPAMAEYAEQDLLRQAELEAVNELDWQRRREEVERRYAQLSARQAAQRPLQLAQLLRAPRAVLLGHPGTGKSTTARYVAYALAAGDTEHVGEGVADCVPVLIRIATYAQACRADPTLHLVEYVERELQPQPEYGAYLRRAVERGRCLILLDGLDEVGDVSLRARVTERIREMVAAYPGNGYLVTSRIVGYDRSPLTRDFVHATLQELGQEERERFVRLWYNAIDAALPEQRRTDGAGNLIEALCAKPQIARLAANPLLLTIVVLMHWRGTTLPNQRVLVYQNATDTLIQYWTAQRGITELEAEEVKNILAPIAQHILSSNVSGVIAHNDLLPRVYHEIAEWRGCEVREARRLGNELLQNLSEESGLFLERGTDPDGQPVYGFLHQTFGEYLAALRLSYEMQSGAFDLARYVHRSVWHEPLLLAAGHLSIYSRPQANALIRQILEHPDPYEEVLRRNVLLAADCLADDIQVRPALRDEVLGELAGLLAHGAPQVQEAALDRYQRLAATRHREAALSLLMRTFSLEEGQALDAPPEVCLNVATALIYLDDRKTARPILRPLAEPEAVRLLNLWFRGDRETEPPLSLRPIEQSEYVADPAKAQRLRFEYWPGEAMDYLLELESRKDYIFSIDAQSDLTDSTLGPVDAGLARRVLGEEGLLTLLERLAERMEEENDRAALQWLVAITPETPSVEALLSLTQSNVPAHIRHLAATRLLESDYRATAIAVLDELVRNEPNEAGVSAAALSKVGETVQLERGLLRDTALLAEGDNAPEAIDVLLQTGDKAVALSAALHLLATHRPQFFYGPTEPMWMVVKSLLDNEQTKIVGLAAARWLALRPGYSQRIQACETLLEDGRIESTIPLLQYLAYECHGDTCQRACGHLLRLGEARLVAPLLARVERLGPPSLRYQACLSLALADHPLSGSEGQTQERALLKRTILDERTRAYRQAIEEFCRIGQEALDTLTPADEQARDAQALGRLSLQWLSGPASTLDLEERCNTLMESRLPAICVSAARLASRMGQVHRAQRCLAVLLSEPVQPLSLPARLQAVTSLGECGGLTATEILDECLGDESSAVREAAAEALGDLGDVRALEPLLAALADENGYVRRSAAEALGRLGDVRALEPLLAALGSEYWRVRAAAAGALGRLGDVRAVEPLLAASRIMSASIKERISFATALVHLDSATALTEVKRYVQLLPQQSWAMRLQGQAQRRLGDPRAALESFEEALRREEINANLIALAHYHLEQGELRLAGDYGDRALANGPGDTLCQLSQAVLLWETGRTEDALARLAQARRRDPYVIRTEDLAYGHFWGPRALATVEAMLARVDGKRP